MSDIVEVKFSEWFQKGFEVFKENIWLLVIANVIVTVLMSITAGILAGPLSAGMVLITLALIDKKEPKPQVSDVFKGFEVFLQSFLFCIVFWVGLGLICLLLSMIPCLGQILIIALSLAASVSLMFGIFLIADKKLDFWTAAQESYYMVRNNIWSFLGFCIVVGVLAQIGAVVCCIGIFFTAPIATCVMAVAYRDVFSDMESVEEVAPATEPVPQAEEPATEAPSSDDADKQE